MDKNTLLRMNFESDKYGSSGWIQNAPELDPNIKYALHPTNNATISGGREYVALPSNTKLTWQLKEKYNLR